MFKPMLAAQEPGKWGTRFPALVSPKIDGVRAIVRDGRLVSRKLIDIPNLHTQALFGRPELEGLDGELVVGMPNAFDCMQSTMSGVMTIEGEPDSTFFVFDTAAPSFKNVAYKERLQHAINQAHGQPKVFVVPHYQVEDQTNVDAFERGALENGFEGIMIRDPAGLYKYGRSTAKEGGLVKVKRFVDGEAIVVGWEEREHNDNEATVDALGHTKRSTHKAGKRKAGDLGALVCKLITPGKALHHSDPTFNIGSGPMFTAESRKVLWAVREGLLNRIVKFRHFAAAGTKELPRHPVGVSFRDTRDF
jgi:ATP-dependent DNA ligase